MNIQSEIENRAREIEQILAGYLPAAEGYQKTIMEAMRYSFLSGGKRLRPMLMLETYRMFAKETEIPAAVGYFMAAIEMIHTYSLIHDDLPAMDNDEYRRGRKTTHVVYGEAMGILAGDALLNYAFETAAKAFGKGTEDTRAARALQILATKAGIYGMLGGQVVDVQNEDNPHVDGQMLEFIYRLKTAALMESAMMIGAVLAGADAQSVALLEQTATKAGIAFQIQDDILDVTSTLEELGKMAGSDEKNHKITYVSMYGIQAAKERVDLLTKEAVAGMDALPVQNEFLNNLLLYLISRKS